MAQYKVIQDIEAEDRLLGPLTLKGFIYAIIAIFCAFINFRLFVAGLGPIKYVLILIFTGPMLLFGVLASPLGRQQPTEVWLLAHLRFLIKPRKRLWSQTGILHVVTVTAPKKIEKQLTKGFSQEEVKNRLQILANTMDSRGWAIKDLNTPPDLSNTGAGSDRLVEPTVVKPQPIIVDVTAADDIMDEQNNPTAQYFDSLMTEADAGRKAGVAERLSAARATAANPDLPKLAEKQPKTDTKPMTAESQAAKLELAQSGNDFSVATLSKLANRSTQFEQLGPNEGLLELH